MKKVIIVMCLMVSIVFANTLSENQIEYFQSEVIYLL